MLGAELKPLLAPDLKLLDDPRKMSARRCEVLVEPRPPGLGRVSITPARCRPRKRCLSTLGEAR